MSGASRRGGGSWVLAVLGMIVAVIVLVVYVVVPVLRGVLSLHGVLYTFGMADAEGLAFAPVVRIVTLAALLELAVGIAMLLDYRDGRRQLELRWAWAVAHGTLWCHLLRLAVWLGFALARAAGAAWQRRPAWKPRAVRPAAQRMGAAAAELGYSRAAVAGLLVVALLLSAAPATARIVNAMSVVVPAAQASPPAPSARGVG